MPPSEAVKQKKKVDKSEDVLIGRVIPEDSDLLIKFVAAFRRGRFWPNATVNGNILKAQDLFGLMNLSPKALADQPEVFRQIAEHWVVLVELVDENNEAIDMPDKPATTTTRATQSIPREKGDVMVRQRGQIVESWVASKGDEVVVTTDHKSITDKQRTGTWFIRLVEDDDDGNTWCTLARKSNGKIPQDAIELTTNGISCC